MLQADNSVMLLLESLKRQNEIYEQMLSGLVPQTKTSKVKENRRNVMKFTKKEISNMPTSF